MGNVQDISMGSTKNVLLVTSPTTIRKIHTKKSFFSGRIFLVCNFFSGKQILPLKSYFCLVFCLVFPKKICTKANRLATWKKTA